MGGGETSWRDDDDDDTLLARDPWPGRCADRTTGRRQWSAIRHHRLFQSAFGGSSRVGGGGCWLGGPAPCLGPPARRSIFPVQLGEGAHVDYGLPARTPAATAAATGVGNDGNCLYREPEASAALESFIGAPLLVPRAPGQAGLRTCRLGSPIPHGSVLQRAIEPATSSWKGKKEPWLICHGLHRLAYGFPWPGKPLKTKAADATWPARQPTKSAAPHYGPANIPLAIWTSSSPPPGERVMRSMTRSLSASAQKGRPSRGSRGTGSSQAFRPPANLPVACG